MPALELHRWANHIEEGSFGEIVLNNNRICWTVERPWLDNKPFVSCVPPGVYDLVPFHSQTKGDVYALHNPELGVYVSQQDIPEGQVGRYAILIHPANTMDELAGCMAPGSSLNYHPAKKRMMVSSSRTATKRLFQIIEQEGITQLTIKGICDEIF